MPVSGWVFLKLIWRWEFMCKWFIKDMFPRMTRKWAKKSGMGKKSCKGNCRPSPSLRLILQEYSGSKSSFRVCSNLQQRSWAFVFLYHSVIGLRLPWGDINTRMLPVLWSFGQSTLKAWREASRDAGADFGKAKPTRARGWAHRDVNGILVDVAGAPTILLLLL